MADVMEPAAPESEQTTPAYVDTELEDDMQELELDSSAPTSCLPSDDTESIVNMVADNQAGGELSYEEEDEVADFSKVPTTAELFHALDTLRSALYVAKADGNLHHHVDSIEQFLSCTASS